MGWRKRWSYKVLEKNTIIEQDFYCNVELSNNDNYTFFMKRSRKYIDGGIEYIVIVGGTKPFEQIKNKKCNYAIRYFRTDIFFFK